MFRCVLACGDQQPMPDVFLSLLIFDEVSLTEGTPWLSETDCRENPRDLVPPLLDEVSSWDWNPGLHVISPALCRDSI